MPDHQDMTPILAKIKKLLALSTSSNPNEAAAAAAKAQALLMQHNLELSQVETQDQAAHYEQTTLETGSRVWRRHLLHTVAIHHFCTSINLRSKRTAIIGQRHNSDVVIYLYTHLVAQLEPMAKTAYHNAYTDVPAITWKDAFFFGAIESIDHRLQSQQRQLTTTSEECRSLVLVKDAELQKAVHQWFPNLTLGRAKRIKSDDGYAHGVQAGKEVALHKALAR